MPGKVAASCTARFEECRPSGPAPSAWRFFADTWEGKTAVVLPAGLTVNVGDVIEFDQGRVDPSDPCQYIPNLAVSKH
jgi:hypothetical protein